MTLLPRSAHVLAGAALLVIAAGGQQTPPTVAKVEPPSWWPRHSNTPVRLLVRGSSLTSAHFESARPDLTIGASITNDRGTYALVDVTIAPNARAGPGSLKVVTASGSADVPFDIVDPLPREGRYQGFGEDDVIYLLMPDRFANGDETNDRPSRSASLMDRGKSRYYHGGDLQGVIQRLPYLRDLGVTTLWLNPVYDNADRIDPAVKYDGEFFTDYHGYGAVDFYAVDEHFGDVATLRQLVDAAHDAGLKVMLDQVANHTGPFHPWVDDPPTPAWFNGTRASHLANSFNAPLLADSRSSPALRRPVLEGWFANVLPDLNQNDPDVARYVIQNSLWWIGMTGADAIRQDTVPYVPKAFWREWTAALAREYPSVRVVGEVLEAAPPFVASFQAGRQDADGIDTGLHSVFDYPLYFALRKAFARGGSMREVASVLTQDTLYPAPSKLVTLLGSHDVRRFMGEPQADRQSLKLAATLLFTMRGIPQWYYGDEIALAGGDDPDNRRDFPGGWPGDARNAFEIAGRTPEEQDVFAHVQKLLHLRRTAEPLRRGALAHLALDDTLYVYARTSARGTAIAALNAASQATPVVIDVGGLGLQEGARLEDALGTAGLVTVRNGQLSFTIPARASCVLVASQRTRDERR